MLVFGVYQSDVKILQGPTLNPQGSDGGVVTWGDDKAGGDSSHVQDQLHGVRQATLDPKFWTPHMSHEKTLVLGLYRGLYYPVI